MKNYIKALALLVSFGIAQLGFAQDESDATVNVVVTKMDGTPREGESILLVNQTTEKAYKTITDGEGKSTVRVPNGATYKIKYKTFGAQP